MKKIYLIIFLTLLTTATFATTFQCPNSLSCKYLNGGTTCQSLPSGWEVIQTLPSTCTSYSTFNKSIFYYDVQSSTFNNVKCQYFGNSAGCPSIISIDPDQDQPDWYPDMSDQFGWIWDDSDKSAAHCSSGACLFTTTAPSNK